jgi:hypothetical protein
MRDAFFKIFVSAMGEAISHKAVPENSMQKYKGKLPDALLRYWAAEGWCGYADGLFWTVNPDDYAHILTMWLEGTKFEKVDRYYVIGRSAFGDLYAWGEKYGRKLTVSCSANYVFALESEVGSRCKDADLEIQSFFSMCDREGFDMEDNQGDFLYDRALKKLGSLDESEMYGFEPALVAGGAVSLDSLVKVNLDVHLTIIWQMGS